MVIRLYRGSSPTVREGVASRINTPSLTVGLLPRLYFCLICTGALVVVAVAGSPGI